MKHIMIAVLTVVMVMMHQAANAQGLSGLMSAVDEAMPVIERLANADEEDLRIHCMGDEECIAGMKNDVKHLNTALDMLNSQRNNYRANREAVRVNEQMMGAGQ